MQDRPSLTGWGFIAFPLAIIAVFTAGPTVAGIALSLFEWSGGGWPRFIGLLNYETAVAADRQLWLATRNTVIFAAGTVPVTVLLAFLAAGAMHARWFRGATVVRTLFFVPTVLSIVAVGFIWQWMLNPRAGLPTALLGRSGEDLPDWLGDSWLGLATLMTVHVWRHLGFCIVLYTAALSRVPQSLRDAASVDGAGPWRALWNVSWPSVRPMTAFLVITGAIWALQVFDLDLVMTGWSPQEWNDLLNTHVFREFKNGRLGYAATVAVFVLVLTAVVTVAPYRWWRPSEGRAT